MRMPFRGLLSVLAFGLVLPSLSGTAQLLLDSVDPLQYVPLQTPCRAVDTRLGGGPIAGGTFRNLNPAGGACNIPPPANGGTIAYAMNVTVVPQGPLGYLTVWPAGELQPTVSTLNSDGRVKANAAIIAGGSNGDVSVFASSSTDVILDVNGYFIPKTPIPPTYTYFPLPPCRVVDTRLQTNSGFGAPSLTGGVGRTFAFQFSDCNLPTEPQIYGGAYSLNVTAIPKNGKPVGFLTVWGTPQGVPLDQPPPPPPLTSLLNAPTGAITANASIVTVNIATTSAISVYASDDTDVAIDVNGYFGFGQITPGGLSLYTVPPCRILDTRASGAFQGKLVVTVGGNCNVPTSADGYVVNVTVVPPGPLGYLTLWPDQATQPVVSTLNANDAVVTSNMAIVQSSNGAIDAFASSPTQLILDVSGYFAP
jgi:hypothetical protein